MFINHKKTICILGVFLLLNTIGISQKTITSYSLPKNTENIHDYNLFITKSSISWACELTLSYSFDINSKFDIVDYLVNAQRNGKIKSYIDFDIDKKWMKTKRIKYYVEIDKNYFTQEQIPKVSSNTISFHEIFYIENHQLKSHIIAAGPEFNIVTDMGINLGTSVAAFSGINYYPSKLNLKNDEVISLGNTYTLLNFDSLETQIGIKKTHGMSLTSNIWYDLSKGFNKIVDLRTNKVIPPGQIIDYPLNDELISVPYYDSLGNVIGSKKMKGAPVQPYFYRSGISQKLYYNKSKDFFYSIIDYMDIYIKFNDQESTREAIEKRFRIFF